MKAKSECGFKKAQLACFLGSDHCWSYIRNHSGSDLQTGIWRRIQLYKTNPEHSICCICCSLFWWKHFYFYLIKILPDYWAAFLPFSDVCSGHIWSLYLTFAMIRLKSVWSMLYSLEISAIAFQPSLVSHRL